VGRPDDCLPDIPWHQHFQAATSLVQKLELPQNLIDLNGHAHAQPPFNMTLAAWIDILGATMVGRTPSFADTYREKLIASSPSGLAELMGCDDRIMYLISEIACLEALKLEKMEEVTLCTHIKLLGDQISLSEPSPGTITHAYSSTGAIRPKQLRRNMTSVFLLAARIYLCSLVPDFDRQQPSITNLINALTDAMEFIPAGPDGFDRSLVWPLLIAGSVSLPTSSFRTMFFERTARLGEASDFGSFGRIKELLKDTWRINDDALARGERQSVHWRDVMRQRGWDFLLI
jgi:C6 transcription factor Pro1